MAGSQGAQRAVRRAESFDEVADLYDAARPTYPAELLTDLVALTGLRREHRILEIGAGTGQVTAPLAKQGIPIVAVERGPNLARLLKRNVDGFPHVSTIVADFDEWESPVAKFDVIVVATASHWLNPATRVAKCASLLRSRGALAVIETHWGAGAHDDRFARESQACYALWDPGHDPRFRPPGPDDLPLRNDELERSGLFREVAHRRYVCDRAYTACAYRDLLGTFSNILAFDETGRRGSLSCVFDLIENSFGGNIVRSDIHDLWLARTGAEN